jgi:anti-anti-sigma regulatory factor
MYGNPAFECGGAQIRAHSRQLATVVAISGGLDHVNLDRVGQHTKRFIVPEKPVILDLGGVNSACTQIVSLLYDVDDACTAAGVEWSLVASQAVQRALRVAEVELPTDASVADALNHFADTMLERRRLLPLLTKSA